jgi:hypothetical protein
MRIITKRSRWGHREFKVINRWPGPRWSRHQQTCGTVSARVGHSKRIHLSELSSFRTIEGACSRLLPSHAVLGEWSPPRSRPRTFVRIADNPAGTRKSHLRRARVSNSGLSNRRVRSLPKKMTLSAQPHFLTVQSPEELLISPVLAPQRLQQILSSDWFMPST